MNYDHYYHHNSLFSTVAIIISSISKNDKRIATANIPIAIMIKKVYHDHQYPAISYRVAEIVLIFIVKKPLFIIIIIFIIITIIFITNNNIITPTTSIMIIYYSVCLLVSM